MGDLRKILKDMHTFLYEDVGSKYGLERGDSIDGRNVQHLYKRDYIRKLTKEAKQAEKAVKGLQSMMRNLESKVFSYRLQLEKAGKELASGRINNGKGTVFHSAPAFTLQSIFPQEAGSQKRFHTLASVRLKL